jgi:hypothetical protein
LIVFGIDCVQKKHDDRVVKKHERERERVERGLRDVGIGKKKMNNERCGRG